jgi:diguanylate cyclase (GGDEF)-like protein
MKHIPNAVDAPAVADTVLHTFRLRLLRLLLLSGICAIVAVWLFEGWTDRLAPIDRIAYPTMIAIFSLSCLMLFFRSAALEPIERLSFTTFAVYVVLHAQPVVLGEMDIYTLASLSQWFPLVYTAAFFFLSTRRAILVSSLIYLAVLVPYTVEFLSQDTARWASDPGLLMFNMFCSHPVYIVTLSGIAKLKTHVTQAGAHAHILRVAASVDYLTGVANRRAAAQLLQHALERANQFGEIVSVMLLDIDHFKNINDTYGHDIGDKVLIQVAAIVQQHLRAADTLGRWGGEEFLIVASATDAAEVARMAERLRAQIAGHDFPHVGRITASFGVATSLRHDTPEALVKRADEALYLAKEGGRDRVEAAPAISNG